MFKELLSTPTFRLGKAGRFAVFQVKLWSHCARLLKKNRSGRQAAALSYHTIFGIVPLTIVMLLIFQLFPTYSGVGLKLKTFVYEQLRLTDIKHTINSDGLEEQVFLTDHLDTIVGGFFEGINEGSIALFSLAIVIWAALALLSTIERAFNNIWHVGKARSFLHRVINYWALLTLGPFLLGLPIYASAQNTLLARLLQSIPSNIAPSVFSYLVATVAFFLLYFVLPNTKVHAKVALWGAGVAALVWSVAKWAFAVYVMRFIPYSQIYGVLGLIPLGVFWIFVTWQIVLFGLQLTFTTQHLKTLDAAEIAAAEKTEENFIANDLTAINIVREITAAFEEDEAPIQAEVICGRLDIPGEFGDKVLNHLVAKGLIARTSDPRVGFVPAKDPSNIKLSEIADALAAAGFAQATPEHSDKLEQIIDSQRSALAKYTVRQILKIGPPKTETTRQKPPETHRADDTNPNDADPPTPTTQPS